MSSGCKTGGTKPSQVRDMEVRQRIASQPVVTEAVRIALLIDRMQPEDPAQALRLRSHMERLRRIMSEIDFRLRSILDPTEANRAMA